MKKIKFICNTTNDLGTSPFKIIILDKKNNIPYNNYFINEIEFELKNNEVYKSILIAPINHYPSMIINTFIVNNNLNIIRNNFHNRILSFKINIIDEKYKNLKIEEGKIKLWLDHIQ